MADHTKLPNRVYVMNAKNIELSWEKGEAEATLTLKELPESIVYFSKEQPKDTLKSISTKEFLAFWNERKTINHEALFLTFDNHASNSSQQHALLQDIFYDENKSILSLRITPPRHEKEEDTKALKGPGTKVFDRMTFHIFQMQ